MIVKIVATGVPVQRSPADSTACRAPEGLEARGAGSKRRQPSCAFGARTRSGSRVQPGLDRDGLVDAKLAERSLTP